MLSDKTTQPLEVPLGFRADEKQLIITGASGFLGRQLVPMFAAQGYRLILCGRDLARLNVQFPGHQVATLAQLPEIAKAFDNRNTALLHLAVMNSNRDATEADFMEANLDYLERVLSVAYQINVRHIIYPSSLQVLDGKQTVYARTKFLAEKRVQACEDIEVTILHLPAVYGDEFQGKLSFLQHLPKKGRAIVLSVMKCLKPAVHIQRVFETITESLERHRVGSFIVTDDQSRNPVYEFLKRTFDVGLSLIVFGLFWWLFLSIWICIRISSGESGLFIQERVGKNQKVFRCYKFQTMKSGTKQAATHEISTDAILPIGVSLRRFKLDEFPQFWNVMRGDMSLIGPRPCLPSQTELINARKRHNVFDLRPGISGLAQVNDIDMSTPVRLAEVDAIYAKKRTIVWDLKIALATLPGIPITQDLRLDG